MSMEKREDFWKDAICEGEISFENSKNQTITRVLVPYERISGRKKYPIISLGGDRVQHLLGDVQKVDGVSGSYQHDLIKFHVCTACIRSLWLVRHL